MRVWRVRCWLLLCCYTGATEHGKASWGPLVLCCAQVNPTQAEMMIMVGCQVRPCGVGPVALMLGPSLGLTTHTV